MILLFIRPLKEKEKWKEDFLSFLCLFYESLGGRRGGWWGVYLSSNGAGWVQGVEQELKGRGGEGGERKGKGKGKGRGRWGKKGRWWSGRGGIFSPAILLLFSSPSPAPSPILSSFPSYPSSPSLTPSCSHSLPLSLILSPSPSPSPYLSPTLSPYPLPPPPLCLVERYPPFSLVFHPSFSFIFFFIFFFFFSFYFSSVIIIFLLPSFFLPAFLISYDLLTHIFSLFHIFLVKLFGRRKMKRGYLFLSFFLSFFLFFFFFFIE